MDALDVLRAAHEADVQNREVILAAVRQARSEGVTWTAIAKVLGVTRWAARERFHKFCA